MAAATVVQPPRASSWRSRHVRSVTMHSMESVRIPITRLTSLELPLPEYFSPGASGMDLPAAIREPVVIESGEFRRIPCGFALAIPIGFEAQIRPRSGLASRYGVTVLNAPGTIDSDYRGEVMALLINHGKAPFVVAPGMRVAQLVLARVARVRWESTEALPASDRGEGGFGHTGA
jgi:dUTP pyrophosphatase